MSVENGEWVMYGVEEDDPLRIKTPDGLISLINEYGFLPLFGNGIKGFSVEERTVSRYWWTDDAENDPWYWRTLLSAGGKVAYGKFFGGKAGYISLDWLPVFANARRGGYDFDSLWDEGLASNRWKKIMDQFEERDELFSNELKALSGLEKQFDPALSELQSRFYLVVRDFRQRISKKGKPYGWALAVYSRPEVLWGSELLSSRYDEAPEESYRLIEDRVRELFPEASEKELKKLIR